MGAGKNEIVGDYMTSFLTGRDSRKGPYITSGEYSNFINVLRELNGGKPVTNKSILRLILNKLT
jgi:hypothetical protein